VTLRDWIEQNVRGVSHLLILLDELQVDLSVVRHSSLITHHSSPARARAFAPISTAY
jgi:hypothetical protein